MKIMFALVTAVAISSAIPATDSYAAEPAGNVAAQRAERLARLCQEVEQELLATENELKQLREQLRKEKKSRKSQTWGARTARLVQGIWYDSRGWLAALEEHDRRMEMYKLQMLAWQLQASAACPRG